MSRMHHVSPIKFTYNNHVFNSFKSLSNKKFSLMKYFKRGLKI